MTDNTEQQAVGGEEAFSSVIQEIGDVCHESYTGCQKTDRLIKEYDYCYTDEIINLLDNPRVKAAISRHYIAKEAVDAVLQEDIEIFEDVPENTRLRLLQLGHNLGVKDFRTALGLDSDHSPTPPDHSQCVSREAVADLLDRLQAQSYLEQEPKGQNALRAQVVRVASINNERRRLNLDSGTEASNE
jgi:hypothetical protein